MRSRSTRSSAAILALALAGAAAAPGAAPALSSAKEHAAVTATITKLSTSGTTVTVSGRVTLPEDTAKERRRTRVLVALSYGAGAVERRSAPITTRDAYRISWRTKLAGALSLSVRVTVGGRNAGKAIYRTLEIRRAPVTTPPSPGALIGTFELQQGDTAGVTPSGSYFEMLLPNGGTFPNLSAIGGNIDFTPLTPGTDGGLETYAYQPPPSPAFSGGAYGGALASAIVEPVEFYGWNFSIVTSQNDPQLGVADPLPVITAQGDTLSGQITDWNAQWNGSSFNQGSPKPDGSSPAPTTPPSGTYDPSTHAFTLTWESRIVGGPFNGFAGVWHLAGTFVPQP